MRRLEVLLCREHALQREPPIRGQPQLLAETAREVAGAHPRVRGHLIDGSGFGEVGCRPVERGAQTARRRLGKRQFEELSLVAEAVGRNDHPTSDGGGDPMAHLPRDDMEERIDRGPGSRRCDDGAGVDIELVVDHRRQRVLAPQLLGEEPMGGHAQTIEQSRISEHERPAAQRHNDRSVSMRLPQGFPLGRRAGHRARGADDDEIGAREPFQ